MTFFEDLTKPSWIPPDVAFPLAWFTLWTLQALALALLIGADRPGRGLAIGLLFAQFVTAVAWQAVVFGPGRLTLAAWWLVAVLILVLAATVAAWRVRWQAGALIAPTIVWMCVATALGFSLLRLNPEA
ncbi:MAG: TspO/MBR family protein [Actinomycetota bacterium]